MDRPPRTRTGRWLTVSASRLAHTSDVDHIAVIVGPARSEDVAPLLLAAYALTESETKIARYVWHGFSNLEIAETLNITPLTVQTSQRGAVRPSYPRRRHRPSGHSGIGFMLVAR